MAYDPSLGKQVKNFRFNFFLREAQEKIKQKILKSPRTSTPGPEVHQDRKYRTAGHQDRKFWSHLGPVHQDRKALRSKAWSEVTLEEKMN